MAIWVLRGKLNRFAIPKVPLFIWSLRLPFEFLLRQDSNHHVISFSSKDTLASCPEIREYTTSSSPNNTLGSQLRSCIGSKSDSHSNRLCSWNVRLINFMAICNDSDSITTAARPLLFD